MMVMPTGTSRRSEYKDHIRTGYVVCTPPKGMCYWCPSACKYWATRPPASDPNEVGKPSLVKSLSSESDNPATPNETYGKACLFIDGSSTSPFSSRIVGTIECQKHKLAADRDHCLQMHKPHTNVTQSLPVRSQVIRLGSITMFPRHEVCA